MKKLLVILGVLVGLGIIGLIAMSFFLGNIVTAGVNNFAPKITQTSVVLASASISPLSGSGTLSGLVVGNPKGWSDTDLCSMSKIHVQVQPFSIMGDHIIVDDVTIDAPVFNYETKLVSSNVGDLLKTISQLTDSNAAPQATAKNGKPIKFEVKHLQLQNGWVRLGVGPAALKLPMPPIELTNLGTSEGGITPDQLVFAVMKSVTGSVVSATTGAAAKLGGTAGAAAAQGAKDAVNGIKGMFSGSKKP